MKWASWFRRGWWEGRMDTEMRFHLESLIEDYAAQGMSRDEAERRARREFGAVELAKEECRDQRPAEWLDHVARDVRYAFRSLGKSPGFTFAAIGTLALGIGANTAIFQMLDAVRLRSLPVKDPQRLALMNLGERPSLRGNQVSGYPSLTNPLWERFRERQDVFAGVMAWANNGFNLAPGGEVRLARGLFVSGDFFRVLGVDPLMGRVFSADDDRRGCGLPGAVISYAFWQREFGGAAGIVGRKLTLNFQPVEVIGVTPAGFTGLEVGRSFDVAVPICSQAALWSEGTWLESGTVWWLTVMGRLKQGAMMDQANAQLGAMSPGLFKETLPTNYPPVSVKDYLNLKLSAVEAGSGVSRLRREHGDPLLLLLATTALVLLIACANLANLMLARATARQHEMAIRLAIGASRGRLVRKLMAESSLIAAGGAALGLALAGILSRFLVSMLDERGSALFLELRTDWRLLAFTAGVAAVTCILFGLAPALQGSRGAAGDAMKSSGRALTASRERLGLRQVLVVAQVALSLVLLVGALLFSGSLRNLLKVDAGFQQNGILIASADMSRLKVPVERRQMLRRDVLERIRQVPGVVAAGESDIVLLSGSGISNAVWLDGSARKTDNPEANFNWISPGYLRTMGIPLLAGRDFRDGDTPESPQVALVNQTLIRTLGITGSPVGMRFRREVTPSQPEMAFEIAGVVGDTKYDNLREEFQPIIFLATTQSKDQGPFAQIMVRSTTSLGETTAGVRDAIARVSPAISVEFQALDAMVQDGLLRERLMATLSGFFGGLAALIAAVGLYGVMSYLVTRRTNEIGIRIALGADPGGILSLVLREAARLLVFGLGAGTVLAVLAAQGARSMLFGLRPTDVRVLGLAALLLGAVTVAASYLPARRAARLAPMSALREE